MDRCVYWLMLEMIFGFGGKRLWQIMGKTDDPEEVCRRILSGEDDSLNDSEKERARRASIGAKWNVMVIRICYQKRIFIKTPLY